nr:MAG TPA: hypothetical protein [Caudoviricetes sp.]
MTQTDKLKLNLPEYTDVVDIEQLNDNFKKIELTFTDAEQAVDTKLSVNGIVKGDGTGALQSATPGTDYVQPNGDGSELTANFSVAASRVELLSGEPIFTLFSKIAKWLNDLGDIAFLQGDVALTDKIDKSYLSTDVQASLEKADTALQSAPVTSVNGQTGEVVLDLDSLPKVTADDNGKFLRVVEGAWGTSEIPNANGVSF